jgi:6-phosphofructokinase 1
MTQIAVLTSGADAPGMNAAIRAVVRGAVAKGWSVLGVRNGFGGLVSRTYQPLGPRDVSGILQKGGTVLGSARYPEFLDDAVRTDALRSLRQHAVDALVVVGGNGSQAGASALASSGFPVVGVPSTIDNDIHGSEPSIGVDTALNVAVKAIDRLKTTAASHQRGFLVEVMGRGCGYLALMAGIAGGAEAIVIPEVETDPDELAREVRDVHRRGKSHAIIVIAEGARWNGERLAAYFRGHSERLGFEPRLTVLGHVQRGGEPGAFDRVLATRLGVAAVERVARGDAGCMVGWLHSEVAATSLTDVTKKSKGLEPRLLEMAQMLAR